MFPSPSKYVLLNGKEIKTRWTIDAMHVYNADDQPLLAHFKRRQLETIDNLQNSKKIFLSSDCDIYFIFVSITAIH